MANYNLAQTNNMQLYDDLKRLFPQATPAMVTETMQKHGCHREKCIEELNFSICSHRNDSASLNYNQSLQDRGFDQPTGGGHYRLHYQPPVGSRSQSVTDAPGVGGSGGDSDLVNQNLPQCPQSAPVPSSTQYGGGTRFLYNNNNNNPPMTSSPRTFVTDPPPSYTSTAILRPPRPPVPPPTYLVRPGGQYFQQPRPQYTAAAPGSPRLQHRPPASPGTPSPGAASSPMSPPGRSSLSFVPVMPHIPKTLDSRYNELWGPPPPFGWIPEVQGGAGSAEPPPRHSTSVNFPMGGPVGGNGPRPYVQVTGGGSGANFGSGVSGGGGGGDYRSQLHISIGPTGGNITASRTHHRLAPATPSPPSLLVGASGGGGFSSHTQYAGSPQLSPRHRSLVDEDDPEQERIGQPPLKPVRSPLPRSGDEAPARCSDPMVSGLASSRTTYDEDAYSQALILHQHQQFRILHDELQKERWNYEEIQKTVDVHERQYFYKQSRSDPDRIFFSFEDIQKLRAEVRSLMIDCECMTRVVDKLHKGQVPLGETNEDFYRTIHTGQEGRVLPSHDADDASDRRLAWPPQRPLPALVLPAPPLPPSGSWHPASPAPAAEAEAADEDDGPKWACDACTFLNSPALALCEMCEMPRIGQAQCA